MASSEYTRGSMDITDQTNTWRGFIAGAFWGCGIIGCIIAYSTLTLAVGMNWLVALVLTAGVALVGGVMMGMGGAWIGAVVAMTALAVFIQIIITLSKLLIG